MIAGRFLRSTSLKSCGIYYSSVSNKLDRNRFSTKDFNAEAEVCRNELSKSVIAEVKQKLQKLKLNELKYKQSESEIKWDKQTLVAAFYTLGFDSGRVISDADVSLMSFLLPHVSSHASEFSQTELAIVAASMHRAQLPVTDQRLMKSLIDALAMGSDFSPILRILKILDLSIRRSLPPESLPTDDKLVALGSVLSHIFVPSELEAVYNTRLMRFWQKLRITTPELEKINNNFLEKLSRGKRPLRKWRSKDISQAVFTCGFFTYPWSAFAEKALEELEYRLSRNHRHDTYIKEMFSFPGAYVQAVLGLLTHLNCPHDRLVRLVRESDLFSRPPSSGIRSIEAWQSLRAACGLEIDLKNQHPSFVERKDNNTDLQRLTGRQYMVLQMVDAAKVAFPTATVRLEHLLPAFATVAKTDIVIEGLNTDNPELDVRSVSLLPLPELACFRRLVPLTKDNNTNRKQYWSIFKPQGSELLRLRCILSSGLVDRAIPVLWPTWRTLRENNRHIFVRNAVAKSI